MPFGHSRGGCDTVANHGPLHRMKIIIESIPHDQQRYPTVGDWYYSEENGEKVLHIKVSKMSNPLYELLVGVHELVEVAKCDVDGVTQQQVDAFDIEFEKNREKRLDTANPDEAALINIEEPGDQPDAPYAEQHCFATGIERLMASALNVNWAEYEQEIYSL